jgi:hypothetical protein
MAAALAGLRSPVPVVIFDFATTFLGVLRDTPRLLVASAKISATGQRKARGAGAIPQSLRSFL